MPKFTQTAPGALVIAVVLAGCSGGSLSSSTPGTTDVASSAQQSAERAVAHPELASVPGYAPGATRTPVSLLEAKSFKGDVWLDDPSTNALLKCTSKGCTAEGAGENFSEPQGLAADAKGNVYIADTANSRVVVLNESGSLVETLSDPGEYPAGVGVATDGTVGVTNILSTSGGSGNVVFYAPGATSPSRTATGLLSRFYFGGFDKSGNFYLDGEDSGGNVHVAVVAKGSDTVSDTGITGVAFPGGVQVDTKDVLNVDDQTCPCIQTYKLPSLTHQRTIALNVGDPVTFAFVKGDADIWVGGSPIGEYSYPAGKLVYTLNPGGGFSETAGIVAVPIGQY
jgi:hypothetical protein